MKPVSSASALLAFMLAAIVIAGCDTGQLVSTEQEVTVGRQAAQQVEKEHRVATGSTDARTVSSIAQDILKHRSRKDITYDVALLSNNEVNAIALPGGWIYIYQGLVDFLQENRASASFPGNVSANDMLAAVIAHEVGHVEARHHAQMMGRSSLYGIAISTLNEGNTQQWANLFANVNLLQYSRSHENESDEIGVKLASRAGYNPYGMAAFLQLLRDKSGSGGRSDLQEMLSTHPSTPERIERATELAQQQ